MNWAHAENIIWLVFLFIFLGLATYVFRWRIQTRKNFADSKLLKKIFPDQSEKKYWFKIFLLSLSLLFGILALMDPLWGEEKQQMKREGVDIAFALDLSNSMLAEDIAPNRLEKAKKIIQESVQNLGGDRVGLIIFAADAYAISPLTNDYAAIETYVETAEPELISNQGTNFSSVIQKAVELFDNTPTTEKLLVILSDGEDNEKSVQQAIKLAKENKINILSMGIGTSSGGPIRLYENGFDNFKRDRNGEVVISKFNENTMKTLASSTNGTFILANHTQEAVSALQNYLSTLNKHVQDTTYSKEKKHVFQYFLALSLFFLFIHTLTTEHKIFNNKKQ